MSIPVVRTSKWTAQHTRGHSWYVARRVWFANGLDAWEQRRNNGRVQYFGSYAAAQMHADALNEGPQ